MANESQFKWIAFLIFKQIYPDSLCKSKNTQENSGLAESDTTFTSMSL